MQIVENISLQPYNTFGISANTRYFSSVTSVDELQDLLQTVEKNNHYNRLPQFVLGGGSNVLFTTDFDGLIIKNNLKGIELVREDEHYYYVKAAAGENWHQFVLYCIKNNCAGVENLSLIPGNVGASPMQNIGAYGVEVKDVFEELEAYHLRENYTKKFSLADCEFGYRDSVFKKKYNGDFVILNVTFRLRKQPVFNVSYGAIQQELEKMNVQDLTIDAVSQAVINIRSSKLPDPEKIGNAGSFFKNPTIPIIKFNSLKEFYPDLPGYNVDAAQIKVAAGWLIEQCGWKGFRNGDAGCHAKQALVLVNYGNASGNQILELSNDIAKSVEEKFGISLETEVNIV